MGQRERLTGGNQDVKKRKAILDGQRISTVNGNLATSVAVETLPGRLVWTGAFQSSP